MLKETRSGSQKCASDHIFLTGYLHVATCSGPARTAERALPCGCRVTLVHASLHGSRLKFFFLLRVRLVCPAFALLVGLMLCLRGVSLRWHHVVFRRCGLSQLPDTLDKFATRGLRHCRFCLLLSDSWTMCLRLPKHTMSNADRYSYTGNHARLPAASSASLLEVSLVAGMFGRLGPGARLSCYRSRRRFLPIVFLAVS